MQLWLEPLAVIAFLILLISCIYMVYQFYVCDNFTCKACEDASEFGDKGSKNYTIALQNNLYNDGIWSLPYIGAAIIAPLSLWILNSPITVKNYAIVFLISFLVIYFLFAFIGHHYVKIISKYTIKYIEDNCIASTEKDNITTESPICNKELDITFAAPVNVF